MSTYRTNFWFSFIDILAKVDSQVAESKRDLRPIFRRHVRFSMAKYLAAFEQRTCDVKFGIFLFNCAKDVIYVRPHTFRTVAPYES